MRGCYKISVELAPRHVFPPHVDHKFPPPTPLQRAFCHKSRHKSSSKRTGGDWGLETGDWGLGTGDRRTARHHYTTTPPHYRPLHTRHRTLSTTQLHPAPAAPGGDEPALRSITHHPPIPSPQSPVPSPQSPFRYSPPPTNIPYTPDSARSPPKCPSRSPGPESATQRNLRWRNAATFVTREP